MKLISYAQNQEDIVLYRALRGVERGFYIDVGAQQPIADSVTKLFYERGWQGINIDPVPQWFDALQADRPHDINLRVAAGSSSGRKTFYAIADTGLSTDDATVARQHAGKGYSAEAMDVEVRTLDDICAQYKVETVHFLKIDVEGAEFEVIRGFSFDRIRPWIVLVEAVAPVAMSEGDGMQTVVETHSAWEPLLLAHGYHHVYSDGLNRFYLAEEHLDLRAVLSVPANPLDAFVRHEEWKKHEWILRLDERVKELVSAINVAEHAHLQRAYQELAAAAEGLNQRIAALEQHIAELGQDNARLAGIASVVQQEIDKSRNAAIRIADLEHQLHGKEEALIEKQARLIDMTQQRDHYHALLQRILGSHSWRMTALFRVIRRFVNGRASRSSAEGNASRSLSRRLVRRCLLTLLGFANRHPRLHMRARAVYSRIPGLRGHLSAFARNNLARQQQAAGGFTPLDEPLSRADDGLPAGVAEVHQRLVRNIEKQRNPRG
jgi:FkbM family methyltransferase